MAGTCMCEGSSSGVLNFSSLFFFFLGFWSSSWAPNCSSVSVFSCFVWKRESEKYRVDGRCYRQKWAQFFSVYVFTSIKASKMWSRWKTWNNNKVFEWSINKNIDYLDSTWHHGGSNKASWFDEQVKGRRDVVIDGTKNDFFLLKPINELKSAEIDADCFHRWGAEGKGIRLKCISFGSCVRWV